VNDLGSSSTSHSCKHLSHTYVTLRRYERHRGRTRSAGTLALPLLGTIAVTQRSCTPMRTTRISSGAQFLVRLHARTGVFSVDHLIERYIRRRSHRRRIEYLLERPGRSATSRARPSPSTGDTRRRSHSGTAPPLLRRPIPEWRAQLETPAFGSGPPLNVVRSLTALANSWVCLHREAMEPVVPRRGMAL